MRERVIEVNVVGRELLARVHCPFLWNLLSTGLFRELANNGYYALGYAEDIVVIAREKFNLTINGLNFTRSVER